MNPRYPFVARRAAQRCEYCHAPEIIFNFAFQVEHVQPQARGGGDGEDNLALSCNACNLFKGDTVSGWDSEQQVAVSLFHPRIDSWEEHLHADLESAEINGRTPCGRVTVNQLQMNRPKQVAARRRWMQLGLFP